MEEGGSAILEESDSQSLLIQVFLLSPLFFSHFACHFTSLSFAYGLNYLTFAGTMSDTPS